MGSHALVASSPLQQRHPSLEANIVGKMVNIGLHGKDVFSINASIWSTSCPRTSASALAKAPGNGRNTEVQNKAFE